MAKNNPTNMHGLTNEELRRIIVELERNVQEARLKLAAGKLDKPSEIWQQAAKLARAKTVLRENELLGVNN